MTFDALIREAVRLAEGPGLSRGDEDSIVRQIYADQDFAASLRDGVELEDE